MILILYSSSGHYVIKIELVDIGNGSSHVKFSCDLVMCDLSPLI